MSLLNEIQDIITEVFSDQELFFYPATLYRVSKTQDNPYMSDPGNPQNWPCLALETKMSEKQRIAIPDADTKILVLHQTLGTDPKKGDVVDIPGRGDRVVEQFDIDPANAVWVLFCRAPDGEGEI